MAAKRPVGFIIIAIVNFVMAILFIGCGVCANVSDTQTWFVDINGVRFDEKKLDENLRQKVPAYRAVKIGGIVTGYLVSIGLILAGAALLFGGLLPKIFALLVYAFGLLHHLVMIAYQLAFVNPAIDKFFNDMPNAIIVGRAPAELARFSSMTPAYISVSWWVLGCLCYLIAAAVVLLSPTSGSDDDADTGRIGKRRRDEEDDDEDEDDRPRRRRSRRLYP